MDIPITRKPHVNRVLPREKPEQDAELSAIEVTTSDDLRICGDQCAMTDGFVEAFTFQDPDRTGWIRAKYLQRHHKGEIWEELNDFNWYPQQ